MGVVLLKYYKYVADEQGLQGKIALAQKSKIPAIQAATSPDSPENIDLFMKIIKEITGKSAPAYEC